LCEHASQASDKLKYALILTHRGIDVLEALVNGALDRFPRVLLVQRRAGSECDHRKLGVPTKTKFNAALAAQSEDGY
jgi:hypothetical protein